MTASISRPSHWVPLVVLLMLAAVPFVAQATDQTFYIAFFARIIIYAIAACALNIALGYGGLVSFGHSLFLGIGGYAVTADAQAKQQVHPAVADAVERRETRATATNSSSSPSSREPPIAARTARPKDPVYWNALAAK